MKRETLPSNWCFPQVLSNSLRRYQVSNARRRGSTCQTRSCILQVQPIVRKIVELCYDSLIQAFLFFIERLGLVILVSGNAISRGRRRDWLRLAQSQLVDNLPAMSQIRCKDQPILAPSQRTIENAEFLLIIKAWIRSFDHGSPIFSLKCRLHFCYILTRTSDKKCHRHAPSPRRSTTDCGSSNATQCQR